MKVPVANVRNQRVESHHIERVPDDYVFSMTAGHLRWMLKWHGDFVRQPTLLEVAMRKENRRRQHRRCTKRG